MRHQLPSAASWRCFRGEPQLMISMGDAEQRKNYGRNLMVLAGLFWVLVLHLWSACVQVWALKFRIIHLLQKVLQNTMQGKRGLWEPRKGKAMVGRVLVAARSWRAQGSWKMRGTSPVCSQSIVEVAAGQPMGWRTTPNPFSPCSWLCSGSV